MDKNHQKTKQVRQLLLWAGALAVGAVAGWLGIGWLNEVFDFVAAVYTRLFQLVAVPTIALAVVTTLSSLGGRKETGRIFGHTLTYTLLTTVAAAAVGLVLFVVVKPENLPVETWEQAHVGTVEEQATGWTYQEHILNVIPNNVVEPFARGNVLSILIIAAAVGLALAYLSDEKRQTPHVQVLLKVVFGLQEVLFTLIKALIWALPVGIVAFAAQLSAQVEAGVVVGSLGRYVAVILGGTWCSSLWCCRCFCCAEG